MGDNKVGLPPDHPSAVNFPRYRRRTISSVNYDEPYSIPISERVRTGIYSCQTGVHAVGASAHTLPAGFWWLWNPTTSTTTVALRKVHFESQLTTALVATSAPRIVLQKFTSTTNATGATIAAVKRRAADSTQQATVYSANTSLTFTQVGPFFAFFPVASATAAGYCPATVATYEPLEDEMEQLAAGEGIMLYQADAGTTSDTRKCITNIVWEEFTLP